MPGSRLGRFRWGVYRRQDRYFLQGRPRLDGCQALGMPAVGHQAEGMRVEGYRAVELPAVKCRWLVRQWGACGRK